MHTGQSGSTYNKIQMHSQLDLLNTGSCTNSETLKATLTEIGIKVY